jgi:hypothetical protein
MRITLAAEEEDELERKKGGEGVGGVSVSDSINEQLPARIKKENDAGQCRIYTSQ